MNAFDLATTLRSMATHEEGAVSISGANIPTEGYFVGGKFPPLIFKDASEIDPGELAWWVGRNPADYYGAWDDPSTGEIHFNGVTHMGYLSTALDLAKIRGVRSVWDIVADDEIRL